MNKVKSKLRQFACEILGVRRVSMRKSLRKIGLESLSFAELLARTEDEFETELSIGEIEKFKNLHALVIYVQEKVG